MSLNIIVLAKQVPDTRNVGPDAMTPEGTVNRSALPAIFNPEDLNALEQALRLKDANPGSTVTVITMGPPRAAEVIRESLYRGADGGYLLTDRAFAGADTLATSYALAATIQKLGMPDVILGGRQAIDGDTAQVGPQVAQKLGLPQVTYVEEILKCAITGLRRCGDCGSSVAPRADGERECGSLPSAQRQAGDEIQARHGADGEAGGRVGLRRRVRKETLPDFGTVEYGRCGCRLEAVRPERFAHQGEGRAEHRVQGQGEQGADGFRCRHRGIDTGIIG